jgi:hypothetical protein
MTSSNLYSLLETAQCSTNHEYRPRICMPTSRNISRMAFQCALFEAQDVLSQTEDVELIGPRPGWSFRFKQSWQRRLLYRDITKRLIFHNPGLGRITLKREYDVFLSVCQNYWDLLYINAIDGWKDYCRTSVCWLDELWVADLPHSKYWLHALNKFDHVFVAYKDTAMELSRILGRTCHWLPAGIDTIRFSPYPDPPERCIDFYSIGRRWSGIHEVLLRAAARKEIFYIYDTFPSVANLQPYDYQQHRDLIANIAKRSRYFLVAPGKTNVLEETKGQIEVGYRYFEGAAAGAVMIGQYGDSESFRETLDWPDCVIEIQPDGSDLERVLHRLEPERVSAISRINASQALLRHDWLYRWKTIFSVAGVEVSHRMVEREEYLKRLADLAAHATNNKV